MNRIVARFAGAFSDAYTKAGGDSREVQGEIFRHPDFERFATTQSGGGQSVTRALRHTAPDPRRIPRYQTLNRMLRMSPSATT